MANRPHARHTSVRASEPVGTCSESDADMAAAEADFFIRSDGLYFGHEDKASQVCSAIRIVGRCANADGSQPALVVRLKTIWSSVAQVEIPFALMFQPAKVADLLLEKGLVIGTLPNARHLLVEYIQSHCPDKDLVRVPSEGWTDIGPGRRGYVLGDVTYSGGDPSLNVILEVGNRSSFASGGTWEDWLTTTGLCVGNPLPMTMMCGGLATALLTPLQRDSFFLTLVGPSSTGKSTTLKLVNSLFMEPGQLLTWSGTDNGIEAAAIERSDRPTAIDEITQGDVDVVEKMTYLLPNSAGKLRADAKGKLAGVRRTRTGILSAGEESLLDRLADAGKKARLGQYARCITIPVRERYGVFSDLHGVQTGAEFAAVVESRLLKAYGLAWPRYIAHLAAIQHELARNFETDKPKIRARLTEELNVPAGDGVVERVLNAFALFAFAGLRAVDAEVVRWEKRDVIEAVRYCFALWMEGYRDYRSQPDNEVLQQLRYILQSQRNKLPPLSAYHDRGKPSEIGFVHALRDTDEPVIVVFPGFLHKQFCRARSRTELDAILRDSGYLVPGPRGTPTRQVRIPGDGDLRVSFYTFRHDLLAG